jgi:uncharacterized protein (DUF488 family)
MERPMGLPYVIAQLAEGMVSFGHMVMLTKISKRRAKQELMSEARHWSFTSVQTVDAWLSGVGFKRTKQVKHASL